MVSGPGNADLSVRVNPQGDTCVDNHGTDAPYVTVASDLEGGVYRVLPDQRVMFEHGSLREMVDHETEPCGCPPETPTAVTSGPQACAVSSAASDNPFPLKESEGLAAPPAAPEQPVVPPGQVHAEVTVPLLYNGENPGATAGCPGCGRDGCCTRNRRAGKRRAAAGAAAWFLSPHRTSLFCDLPLVSRL